MEACHHWLYYSDPVQLFSDYSGLLDLMEKPLADVDNKKIQKILEKASNYHWETMLISGDENSICDALSRLYTRICFDSHKYTTPSPRLLNMRKKASVRNKQLEKEDPLVLKIAKKANMDPDYFVMMNYKENDTDFDDIAPKCELKQMIEFMDRMAIVTLDAGTRLIVRDESEILIPVNQRKQMQETLHFTHSAAESMIRHCK